MKIFKLAFLALFVFATSTVNAGWNQTTIKHLQIPISGDQVFVYFDTFIAHDDCANSSANVIGGTILRKSDTNFEEVYARILIAEQRDDPIQLFSSTGTCLSNFWVDGPYIRF